MNYINTNEISGEFSRENMISSNAVDKTRNMEHPGIFRNIPEHPETRNNYVICDNRYCHKLNFCRHGMENWVELYAKAHG